MTENNLIGCHFCGNTDLTEIINFGKMPPANSYVPTKYSAETCYPLILQFCDCCGLIQAPNVHSPEKIFDDYAYLSSTSSSWLSHAKKFCLEIQKSELVSRGDAILEIACNDGYLLQNFDLKNYRVFGVEPASNIADVAISKGLNVFKAFFSKEFANEFVSENGRVDMVVANNVFAHTPFLKDFVEGLKIILAPGGVISIEVQYAPIMIEKCLFDTVYHEHFSYHHLRSLEIIFSSVGLRIFDAELLPSHGGSIRIYVGHDELDEQSVSDRYRRLQKEEQESNFVSLDALKSFGKKALELKYNIVEYINGLKKDGYLVAGYGAPAKGNTLLNYCGLNCDQISFVTDKSVEKIGKYLPQTSIPIVDPGELLSFDPDILIIMPWNLFDEIVDEIKGIHLPSLKKVVKLLPHIEEITVQS